MAVRPRDAPHAVVEGFPSSGHSAISPRIATSCVARRGCRFNEEARQHMRANARTTLRAAAAAALAIGITAAAIAPALAQSRAPVGATPADTSTATNRRAAIRFVTDSDYPPFNYIDEDGQLTGFNVDVPAPSASNCLPPATSSDAPGPTSSLR